MDRRMAGGGGAVIYLYVAAGGAVGAVLRWLAMPWLAGWAGGAFPWGTLFINAGGSLLIGYVLRRLPARGASPETRAFFAVGICGGYTTFSTYAFETVALAASGRMPAALAYAAGSVVLCVAATFAGFALGGREEEPVDSEAPVQTETARADPGMDLG